VDLRLSVLDVSPVASGSSPAQALANSLDLARLCDRLGYVRYWFAEHHNMAAIASSAPPVMIGHVAAQTRRIRVGSGGVMLPNHSALHVAETFRALEALHPGRIDLGVGRAPGTDMLTAMALRGSADALAVDGFPGQLAELLGFLGEGFEPDHPFRSIDAMPKVERTPPVWLLGSSGFSAALAAARGLRLGFAHHIDPHPAVQALRAYRHEFRPSATLTEPEALLATSVLCAETDELARELASSADLAWLRLAQGRITPLPSVEEARAHRWTPAELEQVRARPGHRVVGDPDTVVRALSELAREAGVDEVMITTNTHDHGARRRSYELLAAAFGLDAGRTGDAAAAPA
jgi:luciferase family oxidoreductase group 1